MKKGKCSSVIFVSYLPHKAGPNSNITYGVVLNKKRKLYLYHVNLEYIFDKCCWQVQSCCCGVILSHAISGHLRAFFKGCQRYSLNVLILWLFGLENLNAVSKVCRRKQKLISPARHPELCHTPSSRQCFTLNICGGICCIFYHRFAMRAGSVLLC